MHQLQYKNIFSVIDDYDVFLFDLWGVIIEGDQLYPGVVDVVNAVSANKQVFFVSNAPRSKLWSHKIITSWGIKTTPEMVITSGEVARQLLKNSTTTLGIELPVIYHLGADRNDDITQELNCQLTTEINDANILLLTIYRDEGEDTNQFDRVLESAVSRKIISICANPDIIIPRQESYRYCAGYFAQKLEQLGGKVIYTGKPYTEIYDQVILQLPLVPKNRILMIGDTFETDILGANRVGINSALVLTGNAKKFHQAHSTIEDKLHSIHLGAVKFEAQPNFVIELTE
jgi:HAD superfamily hydrolase (TIGR01459 family)